jgi:Intu longin-like domain 3
MYRYAEFDDGELMVKTSTDCWVVGKKCDQREVYIIVNQKNANLIEINGNNYCLHI